MTLRRLRWILLPVLGAAALAVVILPPRPLPQSYALLPYALGFERNQFAEDVQMLHRRIVRVSRDRLREAVAARLHGAADVRASHDARSLRSVREPIVVVRDADVPEAVARRWLGSVERELALFPRASGAGVPLILALHTRDPRTPPGGNGSSYTYAARFQYASGTERACIVDVGLLGRWEARHDRFDMPEWLRGEVVGRCGFYARYGFPGPDVRRWAGLGSRWTREWFGAAGVFARPRGAPDTVAWRGPYGGVPWQELTCLRGAAPSCERLAGLRPSSRGWMDLYDYYGRWFDEGPHRIIAWLITQRGPERFASFWASPLPVDSALRAAYGLQAGALVSDVLSHRMVPAPLAQPRAAAFAVSFGWVLVLAGVAMGLSWRREMDA